VTPAATATPAAAAATLATAAGAPVSGAAQVQAASVPQGIARPAVPTQATAAATVPAQAASASGTVSAGAVLPLQRGDGAGGFTAELPPEPATVATAAQAATAATAGTATTSTAAANAAITPNATAGQFTATVVGTTSSGQPVLLAGQTLLTARAASAEPGSRLVLELASARAAALESTAPSAPDPMLRSSLPSLPAVVAAAQVIGGPAQAALAALVPTPGPALAGQMAFFLSALQSGDLRAWIGDPARAALDRAGNGRAVSKLGNELKQASNAIDRDAAASGGWRGQMIPLSNGGAIQPVQLFVHQTQPDDKGNDADQAAGKPPTRFLLDLDLSALGHVQLDALAQPPRFDVILRTPQPLSETIRNDLRLLFTDMTSARGLTGSVSFQVAPPIVPTGTTAAAPRPGILV
jgi:hypothetical protein